MGNQIKILTIGMDGGDERIIRAMPMPNLHKILCQNISIGIEEDLLSRGWAEILSGVHGRESGAFYAKLLLDGTHSTTQKFSITDYAANPKIKPLWTKLSEDGYRCGFMNLPSMMPAPEVDGFAVSGGGAGASTSGASNIPLDACCPNRLKDQLERIGYILDTRFVASGLRNADAFIARLIKMTEKRVNAFVTLCRQYQNEFGFIAFMATNRIQNLSMNEIEELIKNKCSPSNSFQKKIISFYENFDNHIGKIVSELNAKHVMLVSDHGQSPRLYSVNMNRWFQKVGLQTPRSQISRTLKETAKAWASFLPTIIKKVIINTAPKATAKMTELSADWENTTAFSVRYIPGIYINDNKRFGGPIHSEEKTQSLVNKIIAEFVQDPEVEKHGLTAKPYRKLHKKSKYEALLPDIWIDHPDSYFFEQHGKFIERNKEYGLIESLEHVDRDMYTGIKGRHPLLSVDPVFAELVREDDNRDLTLCYKLIVRGMKT